MNRDFSLIDANFARLREGLRVLDEVARFEFHDESLFALIKGLRHELVRLEGVFPAAELIHSRQDEDIGEAYGIGTHLTLYTIIRANCNRVTESLRVLEEFARIYAPKVAEQFSEIRYSAYRFEVLLLENTPHYFLERYFGLGTVYPIVDTITEATWLVEHGAKIIQFRDKDSAKEAVRRKMRELCRFIAWHNKSTPDKVLLILNDYVDIAAELPVAGVHLGTNDGSVARARILLGSNKIIGRSNHSLDDIRASVIEGADYVSIGPVFSTPTKPDRAAIGLDLVRQVAAEVVKPSVAIGGINSNNIAAVQAAGIKNVAVVRAAREFF